MVKVCGNLGVGMIKMIIRYSKKQRNVVKQRLLGSQHAVMLNCDAII